MTTRVPVVMPGPLPTTSLGRLFSVVNGGTPAADEKFWGDDVVWVTPGDLSAVHGGAVAESARGLSEDGARTGSAVVPAGSLIVSTRAPVGYIALAEVDLCTNQGCKSLVPKAAVDTRYYQYVLMAGRPALEAVSNGTTFLELGSGQLLGLGVPHPSLTQQRAIVRYLDRELQVLADLESALVAQRALLLERRRSLILTAVTGLDVPGDRIAGPPWAPSIPATWQRRRLLSLARLGSGHTPSRNRPELWEDPTVPWITTGEVRQVRSDVQEVITETREKLDRRGIAASAATIHPAGTVVLCRTAASAGYSAMMGLDMATSQDFATWTCGPDLDPAFLLYCLRAMRPDLLQRLARGSTHKTIYMPEIRSLQIPLPPVTEQRRIIGDLRVELAAVDRMLAEMDHQMTLLDERRLSLTTAAVTGQKEISA